MSKIGLLFYSERCKNCSKLLPVIEKHAGDQLQMCNIDQPNVRQTIPASVKAVPALLLAGETNALVGDDIYHWINTHKAAKKPTTTEGPSEPGSPKGTCKEFSNGYSDMYSFLDDMEKPQEHAFSFLNGDTSSPSQSSLRTAQETKRDENEVTSRMERFIAQRDKEIPNKGPMFIP